MTLVLGLVERFVYDLGLLIAGEQLDLDGYVEATSARRLGEAVRPALVAGATTRPDFGDYAQVRIEGDLLDQSAPVRTVVEFDDRSSLSGEPGSPPVHARRRVRLHLLLDPGISRVLDHRIELAA